MAAKLKITSYHIIPNILCGLNLPNLLQGLTIIGIELHFASKITLGIRKRQLFGWKKKQLEHLGGQVQFLFFFQLSHFEIH